MQKGGFKIPVFGNHGGSGGEGKGATDSVKVRDGARYAFGVVKDVRDLLVASSCTSFSGR